MRLRVTPWLCTEFVAAAQKTSWLRTRLSQFQEPVGHGGGSDGGPREARDHGREIVSSVEAVLEFGEVARNMLAIDGTVGSCDGGLDVAERGVGPFEGRRTGGFGS